MENPIAPGWSVCAQTFTARKLQSYFEFAKENNKEIGRLMIAVKRIHETYSIRWIVHPEFSGLEHFPYSIILQDALL